MTEPALRVRSISKSYGRIIALRDASFSIARGSIAAFLGENGAGKTTTLKIILGFLKPDSGCAELLAKPVGYIPEHPVFFSWLKGRDVLSCTSRLLGISDLTLRGRIDEMSQAIGFDTNLLARKIQTYSLGNQKKFSYLQNLIIRPELLIVDEPFSSLDPLAIKGLRFLFEKMRAEGKTVLLSSHFLSELEKICDEFIIIRKGKILLQKNLSDFVRNYALVRVRKTASAGSALEKLNVVHACFKEEGLSASLVFPVDRLELLRKSFEIEDVKPLDLENIYFFFSQTASYPDPGVFFSSC